MCLIINRPVNLEIPTEYIDASFNNGNNDGWGFMYPDGNGNLIVRRSMKTQKFLIEEIGKLGKDIPLAIHMRLATHGAKDVTMTHPFHITSRKKHGEDIYMMHNGVLSDFGGYKNTDKRSDTAIFADAIVRPILREDPNILFNVGFQRSLSLICGSNNKLLFMTGKGDVVIINEKQGTDKGGIWYSNTYSLADYGSRYGNRRGGYQGGYYDWSGGSNVTPTTRPASTSVSTVVTKNPTGIEYTGSAEQKDMEEQYRLFAAEFGLTWDAPVAA